MSIALSAVLFTVGCGLFVLVLAFLDWLLYHRRRHTAHHR